MQYRRFGKTELQMPVITCGGMRFQQTWESKRLDAIAPDVQENVEAIIRHAVSQGITHIETARGYGSSEQQLGHVLPSLPREQIIVQTKVGPAESEDDFLRTFETSLTNLQLDYVDLLGIHGINNPGILETVLRSGTLSACRKLQTRGLVRQVGFSTHGPRPVIEATIESGEFAYVNLHWYYFDQDNWPAIEKATERDMGVFIISPCDKGGKLYAPPQKLSACCAPLTPMAFNDLFCLSHPQVHTLSIGAARPQDLDDHVAVCTLLDEATTHIAPVLKRLHTELALAMGPEWAAHWREGLPHTVAIPEEFPLYHVMRMVTMAKAFDMVDYGKMRYNLLGAGDHWFPGVKADKVDLGLLPAAIDGYRFADRIPELIKEAHDLFNADDAKRLSES